MGIDSGCLVFILRGNLQLLLNSVVTKEVPCSHTSDFSKAWKHFILLGTPCTDLNPNFNKNPN